MKSNQISEIEIHTYWSQVMSEIIIRRISIPRMGKGKLVRHKYYSPSLPSLLRCQRAQIKLMEEP